MFYRPGPLLPRVHLNRDRIRVPVQCLRDNFIMLIDEPQRGQAYDMLVQVVKQANRALNCVAIRYRLISKVRRNVDALSSRTGLSDALSMMTSNLVQCVIDPNPTSTNFRWIKQCVRS